MLKRIEGYKSTYEQAYQRNIGAFTEQEQQKVRNLKIAIAGGGGIGGSTAYILAKLGVGKIRIADPETFEASNINRQFGAYIDTLGENKALAISRELLRINPELVVEAIPEALDDRNVKEFLDGVDAVVDGIEFFELNAILALHDEATANNLPIFTSIASMELASFTTFLPNCPKLKNLITIDGVPNIRKAIDLFFPVLPRNLTEPNLQKIVAGTMHVSSYIVAPEIGASILCQELIKVLVKNKEPNAIAPYILMLNIDTMTLNTIRSGAIISV